MADLEAQETKIKFNRTHHFVIVPKDENGNILMTEDAFLSALDEAYEKGRDDAVRFMKEPVRYISPIFPDGIPPITCTTIK